MKKRRRKRQNRHSKIKGKMKGDKCGHRDAEIEKERLRRRRER